MAIELLDAPFTKIESILEQVRTRAAISLPILPPETCKELVEECTNYEEAPFWFDDDGDGGMAADFKSEKFSGSKLLEFRNLFQLRLHESLKGANPYPFTQEPNFRELSYLTYAATSQGMVPHTDIDARNIILVFNLIGLGRFFLCDDEKGSNPVELQTTPGNVTIIRAPGLVGVTEEQWHFVRDIRSKRYIACLRDRDF
jgi:hypothetical protein